VGQRVKSTPAAKQEQKQQQQVQQQFPAQTYPHPFDRCLSLDMSPLGREDSTTAFNSMLDYPPDMLDYPPDMQKGQLEI
jgi:hypothetical protein